MIEDRWTPTDEAELHYLIASGDLQLTPLIYVPGSLGSADDFRDEMKALAPRSTLAVSQRGVGRSSAPQSGYSLRHRIDDLGRVLDDVDLGSLCLMAFSLGVPVAVGYAAQYPDRIKGLILLDYPPRYPERSEGWVEKALPFARGRGIPEHVVHGMQEEAEPTDLWKELAGLRQPILLVKGGQSKAVSDDDLKHYRSLPQVQVEIFDDSDHEIHRPDYQRFISTIRTFLDHLDTASP